MIEFATIFNRAISLNITFLSSLLKLTTLCTGTNFLSCNTICSITCGVPVVTIVILERFFSWSISATAKDSILYPLPENNPTTLDKTLASLSTHTTIMCVSIFPDLLGVLYADLDFVI